MKKFLLVLSCLLFALSAKAAEYEIATALSSPYGMFSTFSVFGNAVVKDLFIGAPSKDNVPSPSEGALKIFRPSQETFVEAGDIAFNGNLTIANDLFLSAPNQSYKDVMITTYSSATSTGSVSRGTTFYMDFSGAVTIATLYAGNLYTGALTLSNNVNIKNLYAKSFSISNGGSTFTFPSVRPGTIPPAEGDIVGSYVRAEAVSDDVQGNCGSDYRGHYYGPWQATSGGSGDTCPGNDLHEEYTCPNNLTSAKNCVDVRDAVYRSPSVENKPYISQIKTFYRRCLYKTPAGSEAPKCMQETQTETGEVSFYQNLEICPQNAENSCFALCRSQGGCLNSARSCVVRPPEEVSTADCAESGWEMGSGLECKDAYTRVVYRVYTCPAGSDYTDRPVLSQTGATSQAFSQKREVSCASQNLSIPSGDKDDAYCNTKFLTLKFE